MFEGALNTHALPVALTVFKPPSFYQRTREKTTIEDRSENICWKRLVVEFGSGRRWVDGIGLRDRGSVAIRIRSPSVRQRFDLDESSPRRRVTALFSVMIARPTSPSDSRFVIFLLLLVNFFLGVFRSRFSVTHFSVWLENTNWNMGLLIFSSLDIQENWNFTDLVWYVHFFFLWNLVFTH